ncbi:SDR family NAD(P)-dependent oxidoreductase [Ochrobactrum sp. AN78]|uniref:SDR family NAD(P)-dependent oxidoreductase n=1 Tax=Ochrobactrum sp. AN78 TaxID=3039853 RepID=UPI002989CD69|nr:SDR family oxidoreductase [Ochrobactrum sp. AN78]MDH7792146.1 NAD(P)-dependent dehydrogenase (short-subunit alcohol dehydrogenase family) [Ochrobactrum sp. AN78]
MQEVISSFAKDLFAGKRVLVSGATSGIGLEMARGFAALGASVAASGSSVAKIEKAVKDEANKGIEFYELDVRSNEDAIAFMDKQSRIDVLINAQGVARDQTEWENDVFNDVMDINLNSVFRLTMAAYPKLKESKGSVIAIASMLSYLADVGVPSYTASKTGILGLTRVLAHKFGPDGVRVNAIGPGYHRTDMTRGLWENPATEQPIAQRAALKRWGETDDLVGAALFLASPAANFITGVTLPVDGGFHSGCL